MDDVSAWIFVTAALASGGFFAGLWARGRQVQRLLGTVQALSRRLEHVTVRNENLETAIDEAAQKLPPSWNATKRLRSVRGEVADGAAAGDP